MIEDGKRVEFTLVAAITGYNRKISVNKLSYHLFLAAKDGERGHHDPIQNAMGAFGKWHIFICSTIFLLKFPVAWHQVK